MKEHDVVAYDHRENEQAEKENRLYKWVIITLLIIIIISASLNPEHFIGASPF